MLLGAAAALPRRSHPTAEDAEDLEMEMEMGMEIVEAEEVEEVMEEIRTRYKRR